MTGRTLIDWMTEHPWLTFFGWCWAWFMLPPLVSVRPYTPKELARKGFVPKLEE